jgi:hypothetical protein
LCGSTARFFERARGVVRLASLLVGFVSLFVQALDQRSLRLELLGERKKKVLGSYYLQ